MSSIWNGTYPWLFWKRLMLAICLIFVVAAAYAARQSAEQAKPASPVAEAAQAQPNLSGNWKLNRDESDDAREKLRSAMQDRDQNGPMGGHSGMGGVGMGIPGIGGIGGMGRPGAPGAGSEEQRGRLRDVVQTPEQLKIIQKGAEIDMTDSGSRVRALFTDGRKIEKAKKDSEQTQVKAHWDRTILVTEEKGLDGEKISHSYELTGEGKQLADTLTVESKRLNTPIIVRSVYDRADGE